MVLVSKVACWIMLVLMSLVLWHVILLLNSFVVRYGYVAYGMANSMLILVFSWYIVLMLVLRPLFMVRCRLFPPVRHAIVIGSTRSQESFRKPTLTKKLPDLSGWLSHGQVEVEMRRPCKFR